MAARITTRKRLASAGVLAAAVLGLTLGVAPGLGGSSTVTAPIQKNSDSCGELTGNGSIGKATFDLRKGTLYIRVTLRGATPNVNYIVYLYENESCSPIFSTNLPTDASGNGQKSFAASSEGFGDFFIDAVYNSDNETPNVHLPQGRPA
jgi:hypothetical protein